MPTVNLSLPVLALLATVWGVFEKLADLQDEHAFRFFQNGRAHALARLVSGVVWGCALGLLLLYLPLASAMIGLGMLFSYIIRLRIDYFNHALATVLAIFFVLSRGEWQYGWLVSATVIFTLGGYVHDRIDNQFRTLHHALRWFFEYRLYIYLAGGAFSLTLWDVAPALLLTLHMGAYEVVRTLEKRTPTTHTA